MHLRLRIAGYKTMSQLRLSVLKTFQATLDGAPVAGFRSAKTQALLIYLAVEADRPHRRDVLAGLLWPDHPERAAQHNLSQSLLNLRQALGDADSSPPFFLPTRQTLQFNPASPYWLDLGELLAHLAAAQAHAHTGALDCEPCMRELALAVELYRAPFLAEFSLTGSDLFEEWALVKREWLHRQVVDALNPLIDYCERQGDHPRAERYARRLVDLDPFRESAHRQLMRALARGGQHAAALAQYEVCRRILAAELGATPAAETTALYEQIRANELRIENEELRNPEQGTAQFSILNSQFLDAPDLGSFYGRAPELALLQRWLVAERCRVVMLLGIGGVGKTALAAKLAGVVRERFDRVIWRSLVNAPPLGELLQGCLQALAAHDDARAPTSPDAQLDLLLAQLRRQRCLLILDNFESILQTGERTGSYRPGYEDYRQLLEQIAQSAHASCLLLTSREQPLGLDRLEGDGQPVRALRLAGLDPEAGRSILRERGLGDQAAGQTAVVERYSGNPLALKLVAATIRDLFAGNIAAFLRDETPIFDDIRHMLDQQFARLSALERELLIWLAIEREPTAVMALQASLVRREPQRAVLEALRSLQRRSLLEQQGPGFTLQNVVMEYTTDFLVTQVVRELEAEQPDLFVRHALAKAQAKEYLRQTQARLILAPIAQQLSFRLGAHGADALFRRLLRQLRLAPRTPGYGAGNILNLVLQLAIDPHGYDFSRLCVWQADLRGAAVRGVDFSGADLADSAFTDAFQVAASIAFSPDGRLLAGGTGNGVICLWQFADGQLWVRAEAHAQSIWSVAFSPDGRRLASASEDQTIQIRQVGDRQSIAVLAGHQGWVRSVAFSPDGELIASASDDMTLRLWHAERGEPLRVLAGHTSRVRSVAFSPDGRLLASGSADHTVRLWDVASGRCARVLEGHTSRVRSVAFSPDGRLLASASHDQSVTLWDVVSGQIAHVLRGHTGWVQALAFSPDGRLLASGGADQSVWLWSIDDGAPQLVLHGHQHTIEALAFHPSGAALASSSRDQTVRLWDIATGRSIWRLQGHTNRVRTAALSPDGATLASTSADALIWLWDLERRDVRGKIAGNVGLIEALIFSPDGQLLACAGEQGVQISNTRTGTTVQRLREGQAGVYAIAFDRAGAMLASGGRDGNVDLWDVRTGRRLRTLQGHTDWIKTLALHPGGQLLASGSDDLTVRIWDLAQHAACRVLHGHTNSVSSVAFSPDGSLLASGSNDWSVCLWDTASGERRALISGHQNSLTTIAFSPDSRLLASAGLDRSIRIYDVRRQQHVRALQGHTGAIRSVTFSPDGATLISSSDDETMRLWDVGTGQTLATLRTPGPYEGMNIAGATGLTEGQRTTLKALGAVEI
jgi:WD40 repeat protein/DNA-binding SARP family transcriptional activator